MDQPGLKKPLPLRLFEISDIVKVDKTTEVNARNERRFCATIADGKSRFEEIHGLLDRFFVINGSAYRMVAEDSPTCISGQRAKVLYNDQQVGWIGVIHPLVLRNFDLTTPVVAFELLVEPFMARH
jgi:phenylalanyl-tRNA synthetase beta chain